MCTYDTVHAQLDGSAKGPGTTWQPIGDTTVYFDHPVHTMAEHTLNIDFGVPTAGVGARVAVELTADSARALAAAIDAALSAVPAELLA